MDLDEISPSIVERDGEWCPCLILKREGDRFFVHQVGTEMSDNEWVSNDRVRFPASSRDEGGSPWDWTFPAGAFDANHWCANKSKAAPVDAEL